MARKHSHAKLNENFSKNNISHLIVIHDSVERLYPHWVDVAVENDPLRSVVRHVRQIAHDARKESVLPFSGRRVDDAEQLVVGHCLRVEINPDRSALLILVASHQRLEHLREGQESVVVVQCARALTRCNASGAQSFTVNGPK